MKINVFILVNRTWKVLNKEGILQFIKDLVVHITEEDKILLEEDFIISVFPETAND